MKENKLRVRLLFITLFLLIQNLLLSIVFAQDYTNWHLPEGAKIRLGKGEINDVKFSPNGSQLAVATDLGVWIYDAHTGDEISLIKVTTPRGTRTANTIAFSPDNRTIAVGNWVLGGAIELWDTTTGERISILKQNVGRVKDLVFSPNGMMLTSVSWFRQVEYHMWEVASGQEIHHFIGPQDSLHNGLALSPDAHYVSSAESGKVLIWDAFTGELHQTLENTTVWSLAFSTDSKTLVGGQTTLRSWDIETGKEVAEFKGHTRNVEDITFSPDGKTFASGDTGGKIILWDFDLSNQVIDDGDKKLTLPGVLRSFTGDKKEKNDNKQIDLILTGHTLPIKGLDFTADSKFLASGCDDGTLKVWNVDTGKEKLTIHGHTGSVQALKLLDDEKMLYSISSDGILRMWNLEKNTEQLVHTKQPWYVFAADFSNDGKLIATGCWGEVRLWDIEEQSFYEPMKKDGNFVVALAFSQDDKFVASGHWKGKLRLWDVPNRRLYTELNGHTKDVKDIAFSSDGKKFASGSTDGTAYLWNLSTMKNTLLTIDQKRGVGRFAFSPDSRILITVHLDGTMQIWDTDTHKHIENFIDRGGIPDALEFSSDGKTVYGYHGGIICIYDVDSRTLVRELPIGDIVRQTKFAFSPDRKTLVSGGYDGSIHIWDLEKIYK